MPRVSFSEIRGRLKGSGRNPRVVARVVLGTLVAANLIAALIVFKPWSGSAEDLERQAASLRQEVRRKEIALGKLRGVVSKVQAARTDGDGFMRSYLLSQRSVSSRLAGDLDQMASQASIRQKEVTFAFEPVEGSDDTLTKATMTANYEGTYADLMHFLNLLDRSPRLIIIESLAATPQPQGLVLNITMKLNAFVREGASAPDELAAAPAEEKDTTGESAAAPAPAAPPAAAQPAPQAAAEAPAPVQAQAAQPPIPPPPAPASQWVRRPMRPVRGPATERSAQ